MLYIWGGSHPSPRLSRPPLQPQLLLCSDNNNDLLVGSETLDELNPALATSQPPSSTLPWSETDTMGWHTPEFLTEARHAAAVTWRNLVEKGSSSSRTGLKRSFTVHKLATPVENLSSSLRKATLEPATLWSPYKKQRSTPTTNPFASRPCLPEVNSVGQALPKKPMMLDEIGISCELCCDKLSPACLCLNSADPADNLSGLAD